MLTIDNEFKKLLAPLLPDEREELERNILARGCLDPLKAWRGILIDGHNRYEICTKHALPYKVTELSFDDRDDVIDWIIDNQIGRRNLTPQQASYYRGVKQERAEKRQGARTDLTLSQNATKLSTAESIAKQHGVNKATIYRDAAYARAIDTIAETAGDEVKHQILSGEMPLTKKEVVALAESPVEDRKNAIYRIANNEVEPLMPHVARSSGNNEWYTPQEYITAARAVLGEIDIDPASSAIANRNVKAAQYFSLTNDGLKREWKGKVWLNPPYASELIGKFCLKLCRHFSSGQVTEAIVLVNNATETQWFQDSAVFAKAFCFPRGRIKFLDVSGLPVNAPLQGQVFLYFGKNPKAFISTFKKIGVCAYV